MNKVGDLHKCLLLIAVGWGTSWVFSSPALAQSMPVGLSLTWQVVGQAKLDAANVLGNDACKKCHEAEVNAWLKSKHATTSFAMLTTSPKAKEFADKLKIPAGDIATGKAICTECHGTRQGAAGNIQMLSGNSCESCHGASGPQAGGWFALHSDFGGEGVKRDAETADHYQARLASCDKAGMNRGENIYDLAKNCYSCHTVTNEDLVDVAGHPAGNPTFEFLAFSRGEVRHNFQQDQKKNALAPTLWTDPLHHAGRTAEGRARVKYVVGQMVDLEVSLQKRAGAEGKGNYAKAAGTRITAAKKKLEAVQKQVAIPEVQEALDALKPITTIKLLIIKPEDKPLFDKASQAVAAAAQKFSTGNDGSKLAALDSLLPKDVKGTPAE